jgi:hypothetical protein
MPFRGLLSVTVASTCIRDVAYNGATEELYITFTSGGMYTYSDVPYEVVKGLTEAPSKGRYMHQHILGRYSYRKN